MTIDTHWKSIQKVFLQAFYSSFHYAMATVTPDGRPHVTPIGSLILLEPGHAIYFEEYPRSMPRNFESHPEVCVLAVHSGLLFWLAAILRGRFRTPPAIRLHGTVGQCREATAEERALWGKRTRHLRRTKGYGLMWAGMHTVRDVNFSRVEGVHFGEMTRQAWVDF